MMPWATMDRPIMTRAHKTIKTSAHARQRLGRLAGYLQPCNAPSVLGEKSVALARNAADSACKVRRPCWSHVPLPAPPAWLIPAIMSNCMGATTARDAASAPPAAGPPPLGGRRDLGAAVRRTGRRPARAAASSPPQRPRREAPAASRVGDGGGGNDANALDPPDVPCARHAAQKSPAGCRGPSPPPFRTALMGRRWPAALSAACTGGGGA